MDLYDQRDRKGQMLFISFKEGFPKDYLQLARNVLNQLPAKFPTGPNSVAPSNEVWNIGNRIFAQILVQPHALTAIQQHQRYAIVCRNVLTSNLNQHAVVKKATYVPLICYENSLWTKKQPAIFGGVVGRSSRLPDAQAEQPSKDSDQTCNVKWLQRNLSSQASTTGA